MLTRRELIRLGLVGTGYALLPYDEHSSVASSFADIPITPSPATTPFVTPLPIPPFALEVPPFYDSVHLPGVEYRRFIGPATRFYHVVAEERAVRFHPSMPQTLIWGYRDKNVPAGQWPYAVGPILGGLFGFEEIGTGMVVRHANQLPANHTGFGVPMTTAHLHGGHHIATSDGFPTDITGFPNFVTAPGGYYDHCFPLVDPGFLDYSDGRTTRVADVSERPSTLWYHDHLLEFTAQNVYRGLAGIAVMSDELDSGDEDDRCAAAPELPVRRAARHSG
jgi:hypothetical protein